MALAWDLPPIVALAVVTLCIAILLAYKATVGQLIVATINLLERLEPSVLGHRINIWAPIIDALKAIDNYAYEALGKLIDADKAIWAQFVTWNAYAWQEVSAGLGDLAHDTGQALHHLRKLIVPAAVAVSVTPIWRRLHWLQTQITALTKPAAPVVEKITKIVHAKAEPLTAHEAQEIASIARAAVGTLPLPVANPWPRIHDVEGEAAKAWDAVKRLGKTLTPAGIVGLTAGAVLSQLGLGWTRCSGVANTGKALCQLGPQRLEKLLADMLLGVTAIFGTLSLVELAKQMQGIVGDLSGEITHFWRADLKGVTRNPGLGDTGL